MNAESSSFLINFLLFFWVLPVDLDTDSSIIYETMPTIRVHIFAVACCISAIRYAAADSMASISVDALTGDLHINPVI